MKRKSYVLLLLTIFFTFSLYGTAFAYRSAGMHWQDIRYVLFGDKNHTGKDAEAQKNRKSIEYASQICIDQFQGSHSVMFQVLQKVVPRLSSLTIDDINLFANPNTHHRFTHKGWSYIYENESKSPNDDWAEVKWPKRQDLFLATADEIFNFNGFPDFADPWFDYDHRCKSFCALVYYIHLLGDHIEFKCSTYHYTYGGEMAVEQILPLGSARTDSIISEILENCKILFPTQIYSEMERELEQANKDICSILDNPQLLATEEGFAAYHEQTIKVREILRKHIPGLLKKEAFFKNVFY